MFLITGPFDVIGAMIAVTLLKYHTIASGSLGFE